MNFEFSYKIGGCQLKYLLDPQKKLYNLSILKSLLFVVHKSCYLVLVGHCFGRLTVNLFFLNFLVAIETKKMSSSSSSVLVSKLASSITCHAWSPDRKSEFLNSKILLFKLFSPNCSSLSYLYLFSACYLS